MRYKKATKKQVNKIKDLAEKNQLSMSQVEISLLLRGTEVRRLQMKQHIPVLKMVSHMTRNGVFNLIKELADCDAIEKGVILGIKANSDNLRGRLSFFEMQQGDLTYVTDSRGRRFVMLFTSKKKFELCPDIQGYVCFIKELFEALAVKEAVDGIAFNINSDGILLDKFVIRIVLEFINRVGE